MKTCIYKGLAYANAEKKEIYDLPFNWGNVNIMPGTVFEHIGSKKRTQLSLKDAKLKYCGRNNENLFFSIVTPDSESANDNWYLNPLYVNSTTLLMQSSNNGFWDIKL